MKPVRHFVLAGLVAAMLLSDICSVAFAEDPLVVAGEAFFNQRCQTCHNPDAASKTYGPPLKGVIGRKAGVIEGFAYSEALKSSGIVWTEASLRAWMEDNDGMLPGTRMRHVGVADRAEQDMIVSYLRSLAN